MVDSINGMGASPVVFATEPDFRRGLKTSIVPGVDAVAFVGTKTVFFEQNIPRRPERVDLSIFLPTRETIYEWESFFNGRRGKLRNFWLYMPLQEFELKETIINATNFAVINYVGYELCAENIDRLYLLLASGDVVVRVVDTVEADEGHTEETITFATAFDREIAPADVVTFGRVLLGRFDLDSYSLKLESDSVGDVTGRFYELVQEYADVA
jgi:hypothetical protein